MKKRKSLMRVTIIFFVVLALASFFSRSIFYFVTPKVVIRRPETGITTEYPNAMRIPSYALIDDSTVYTVNIKQGFMQEKLILEKQSITVLAADEKWAFVEGLATDSAVVTDWDRPLYEGSRVMLPVE